MIYGSYQRTKGLRTSVDANGKNNINKRLYYLQMFLFGVTTLARYKTIFLFEYLHLWHNSPMTLLFTESLDNIGVSVWTLGPALIVP